MRTRVLHFADWVTIIVSAGAFAVAAIVCESASAEPAAPALQAIFPAGGQVGTTVEVAIEGTTLEATESLRSSLPGLTARRISPGKFAISIPADAQVGTYDVFALGPLGISSPRSFVISRLTEVTEAGDNDRPNSAQVVGLNTVVNGRIEKPGDVDCYRFQARAGQRIVLECFADRIDSQLRAVLDVFDAEGKRVAGDRASPRIDPLFDFVAPADGEYTARLHDLSYSGGSTHFYRLDIDTGPRVEYAVPAVVERGKPTRVALYGRNLPRDPVEVEVLATEADSTGLRLLPSQVDLDALAYRLPGGHAPILLSQTDVPVTNAGRQNRSQGNPLPVTPPCEVSGQLIAGDEQLWLELQARRGEVFWLEAFGERLGATLDLDVVVLDSTGQRELAHFSDNLDNPLGYRFPLAHLDPAGKWVAPADGRYLVMLRNLTGGVHDDPRRVYRLSLRREEPDFSLAVVSRRKDQPAALNIPPGGREMYEVVVSRRRGMTGEIRVTAAGLPDGLECPEISLGPNADRAPLVFTASDRVQQSLSHPISLTGICEGSGPQARRMARAGTMIWPGQPMPSGRIVQNLEIAATSAAMIRLTASAEQRVVSQDGSLDIAVEIERSNLRVSPSVALSAVGLPNGVSPEVATISAGSKQGWISFQIPPHLSPGTYSLAILGETEALAANAPPDAKPVAVTAVSNAVTFRVDPARIALGVDPRAPARIGRGKIIQLNFFAERKHGFIGKTHVELVAPGGVVGLRGRGVTLVGQTDSGVIQIIANEDAPLGQQPFLRLEAVGTVEDRPVYRATRLLNLEIVE